MDILACPDPECRSELELQVFTSHMVRHDDEEIKEIDDALITCPKCGRWYPVIDGIPCMLPDDLREGGKQRIEETKFLKNWKNKIPKRILEEGRPFGLTPKG
ncbi:Trm112 family protein [Candidatus Thorarchaeota archaeon]|nr:MAG: Trm112 family protein [Candidatus Thorarchaeota archaeon]